ncbi:reverse transcriptase domain-containing protein [Citrus sinensis]|nr:reverse transcriptase domain-containing protein [Citrus sinensis]
MTIEMNEALDQPSTADEIFNALFQMCPTKAPGPDRLPATGVIDTCLHILNAQGDVTPLNHTYIALIPKVAKPKKVTDFRPISLCNVIFKIVAKTMANRLKQILHQVISPTQSAFIPNRLITDNIIIGYECLHKIRHNKSTKKGVVALKLDISKAYDRVEWKFLEQTMGRLGFSHKWIKPFLNCITTINFSVIINGKPKGLFRAQRGLRQRCPLSPYLFLICAEAFSNLLKQAERQNLIHGLRFGQEISITHLLFADDSLIFARASTNECNQLKALFDSYVSEQQAETIKNIFQLNVVSRHKRYLGLPSIIGQKKMSFFNDVKLRVLSKIANWQHKFFSTGGKEVLIKAVAQAIPAYAMSVFKLPIGLCEDIQIAVAKFWWGSKEDKHKIHWAKWEKLSHAKCRGAMVAKQGWRILQDPNSLTAQVLKARYLKCSDFWNANLGSNPSFLWRSLLWGRQVLKNGARWRIGRGDMVQVYKSNWIPRSNTFKPFSMPSLPEDVKVAELIDARNQWKTDLILEHFNKEDAAAIMRIPLPRSPKMDEVCWHFDKKFIRSVETISHALIECKAAGQDMLEVWFQMSKRLCKADLELLGATWWITWNARNRLLFKGEKINSNASAAKAQAIVEAYQRVKHGRSSQAANREDKKHHQWTPPPAGSFKINVDAATNVEAKTIGLRAVIRDDKGRVVAAAVKPSRLSWDVQFAEAEAVELGLQVAKEV